MKEGICTGIGVVGGVIASLFGGWDAALITLMIFMGIDYLTGLSCLIRVFHSFSLSSLSAFFFKTSIALTITEGIGTM